VVVNPCSAGGATRVRWPWLRAILARRGLRFQTLLTEGPGQAGALARQAAATGAPWIICVGGDGTFNELVNGLAAPDGQVSTSAVLGFIPSGTGLDLARNLRLPLSPFQAAEQLGTAIRRIDLGRVRWEDGHCRLFVNMAGAGFDAEVARRVIPWRRHIPGKLCYALGILATLPGYGAHEVKLEIEAPPPAQQLCLRAMMVVACNAERFGGGMRLAPGARLDDGALHLFILGEVPPLTFLARLPSVYWGAHLARPEARLLRTQRVRVTSSTRLPIQTDGEPVDPLPATFDVLPSAISILT
jgi:diacylglycerol kinase (ATP)